MPTEQEPKADATNVTMYIDAGQTRILWGLLDAPNMGVPFKDSESASKLFKAIRAAAVHHGILSE
jgi:hypothetical protein